MPPNESVPEPDQDPYAGPWQQLSFGVIDLARALRRLDFAEAFVERAVLEFIRVNPLDQSRPTPEVYVLTAAENEAVRLAGMTSDT